MRSESVGVAASAELRRRRALVWDWMVGSAEWASGRLVLLAALGAIHSVVVHLVVFHRFALLVVGVSPPSTSYYNIPSGVCQALFRFLRLRFLNNPTLDNFGNVWYNRIAGGECNNRSAPNPVHLGRSAPTLQPTCRPSRPKKKGGRVSPPPLFGSTTHRTCRSCAFRALAAYRPLGAGVPPLGVPITLCLSVARPAAFIGSGSVGITRILPNNNTIPHSEPLVKSYTILHRHLTTSE